MYNIKKIIKITIKKNQRSIPTSFPTLPVSPEICHLLIHLFNILWDRIYIIEGGIEFHK